MCLRGHGEARGRDVFHFIDLETRSLRSQDVGRRMEVVALTPT